MARDAIAVEGTRFPVNRIEPVRRFASVRSHQMSYLEWRAPAAPSLVFVHATGFNAQTYLTLLAPIADRFDVVACDLRGHGFSTLPASPGLAKGWTVFREDLAEFLDGLSGEPIVLAGHSLGATVGLMTAAVAPSRIRAVVLIEPVLLPPEQSAEQRPNNGLVEKAAQRRSAFPSPEAALDAYRGRGIFASWPEMAIEDYLAGGLIEAADGSWRLACAPAWEAEIFRESPPGIARIAGDVGCPITIVHGTVASTATPSELDLVRCLNPETRIVTVGGAGHFLPIEQPQRVREEIETILANS